MLNLVICCLLWAQTRTDLPTFSSNEWDIIRSLSPAKYVPDSTNKYEHNPHAAALGQALFFDQRFSSTKDISCATCHDPKKYFTDGKQVAKGVGTLHRNTPSILNAAHQRWFFWDGRTDVLWGQPIQTIEHPDEMNFSREEMMAIIEQDDALLTQWVRSFQTLDPQDINGNAAKVSKALAAFMTQLDASQAPFDKFVAGDTGAISDSAQRGLKFFISDGGCLRCHFGPWFTDGAFHTVGIPPLDGGSLKDSGRAGAIEQLLAAEFSAGSTHSDDPEGTRAALTKHIASRSEDWGTFRTPSLRNVGMTAPYMHAGQLKTLDDVLEHYSTLEQFVSADHHRETILEPLHLTERQNKDLIAFLQSLTAPLPDAALLKAPK